MADEVGICNAALQLIKHSKVITSLEQGTKEANACEVIFTEMRDALLEMHNWNFASERVKLGQLSTTPAFGWTYEYQLPADFIRVVKVSDNVDERGKTPYKLEKGKVRADAEDIYLRYVTREEDPNLMPATFRLALSKLLASRLAVSLSQSASLSKEMYEQFVGDDLPTAKSTDALQDDAEELPESDWVTARYGGHEAIIPGDPAA
jgi:hypothetical protein